MPVCFLACMHALPILRNAMNAPMRSPTLARNLSLACSCSPDCVLRGSVQGPSGKYPSLHIRVAYGCSKFDDGAARRPEKSESFIA